MVMVSAESRCRCRPEGRRPRPRISCRRRLSAGWLKPAGVRIPPRRFLAIGRDGRSYRRITRGRFTPDSQWMASIGLDFFLELLEVDAAGRPVEEIG